LTQKQRLAALSNIMPPHIQRKNLLTRTIKIWKRTNSLLLNTNTTNSMICGVLFLCSILMKWLSKPKADYFLKFLTLNLYSVQRESTPWPDENQSVLRIPSRHPPITFPLIDEHNYWLITKCSINQKVAGVRWATIRHHGGGNKASARSRPSVCMHRTGVLSCWTEYRLLYSMIYYYMFMFVYYN